MYIIAATHNKNKLREFGEIFGCDVHSASDLGVTTDPEENGKTFSENSKIKATAIYDELITKENLPEGNFWVIADDSGLCVDALDGAPGVYSARYASTDGHNATDEENVIKLLKELENVKEEDRKAAFVCAITAINRKGEIYTEEGYLKGYIAYEPAGNGGFGYDPVMYIKNKGKTVAEMTPDEKNAISHRGQALKKLKEKIWS